MRDFELVESLAEEVRAKRSIWARREGKSPTQSQLEGIVMRVVMQKGTTGEIFQEMCDAVLGKLQRRQGFYWNPSRKKNS